MNISKLLPMSIYSIAKLWFIPSTGVMPVKNLIGTRVSREL